jgi:hypothetical protein
MTAGSESSRSKKTIKELSKKQLAGVTENKNNLELKE